MHKSAIRTEDADDAEQPMSSMGNTIPTNQASESEITEKDSGPSKPSEQLKYIRRFLLRDTNT